MTARRTFFANGRQFVVEGLRDDDPYLLGIDGTFEAGFQTFCSDFLQPDSIAIDIGANIGATSIILSSYLHEGKVYAVEPGKTVYELLGRNVVLNRIDNVTAINCAVSDRSCSLNFLENSAYGHINLNAPEEIHEDPTFDKDRVEALTLDDLVDDVGIERLDFLKIDVEGFEPHVLKGATKTLERFNPLVYLELNTWCLIDHSGVNPVEFAEYLMDNFAHVYRVRKATESGPLLEKVTSPRILVHENIVSHNSVDDVILSNDPSQLQLSLFDAYDQARQLSIKHESLSSQLQLVTAERDAANSRLQEVTAERDAANSRLAEVTAELDATLNSRSWRMTKPMRSVSRLLR